MTQWAVLLNVVQKLDQCRVRHGGASWPSRVSIKELLQPPLNIFVKGQENVASRYSLGLWAMARLAESHATIDSVGRLWDEAMNLKSTAIAIQVLLGRHATFGALVSVAVADL